MKQAYLLKLFHTSENLRGQYPSPTDNNIKIYVPRGSWGLLDKDLEELPINSMLGSLVHYITNSDLKDFQPMKANFGILPAIENGVGRINKRQRAAYRSQKALHDLDAYIGKL